MQQGNMLNLNIHFDIFELQYFLYFMKIKG